MSPEPREAPSWSTLLGMGTVSAALFAVGLGLGWWLDSILHTFPVMVLIGIAVGIVAGASYTIVKVRTFLKE